MSSTAEEDDEERPTQQPEQESKLELNRCSEPRMRQQTSTENVQIKQENNQEDALLEEDSGHAVTSLSSSPSSVSSSSPVHFYNKYPSEPSTHDKPLPSEVMTPSSAANCAHAQIDSLTSIMKNYDPNQIYLVHVSFLDWRDLPGKRSAGERVWVVGATDHDGRHRTRLLVTGKYWRPRCLKNVNMLSQPVIYAGGGRGSLTADLFLWWFHHEFAITAMAMHPAGAILVAERADYLPPEVDCVAADGLVRLFIVPEQYVEPKLVTTELRIRMALGILSAAISERFYKNEKKLPLERYVRKFTLKEAFAELHRAWLGIRSETFTRSWVILQDREEKSSLTGSSLGLGASQRFFEQNEDHLLIVRLQRLARDAGIEVDEKEVSEWVIDEESRLARNVKLEEASKGEDIDESDDEEGTSPTAREAVGLLSKVLLWMEQEPLDPSLLLTVRSMKDTATFMVPVQKKKNKLFFVLQDFVKLEK